MTHTQYLDAAQVTMPTMQKIKKFIRSKQFTSDGLEQIFSLPYSMMINFFYSKAVKA